MIVMVDTNTKNIIMVDQYKRIQGANLKINEKSYCVYKGVNTIGRNKLAIINVKNLNVSQQHALIIIVDDTQHFISDLNSSNGTYLFGSKLLPYKLYELTHCAEVCFGDVTTTYFKLPDSDTTTHLEQETVNMTQNMTQGFYGASTQLMINESCLNQTNANSTSPTPNTLLEDIHEAATQVVIHPTTVFEQLKNNTQNNSKCIVEILDDIHNAPTQVVNYQQECTIPNNIVIEHNELEIIEIAPQINEKNDPPIEINRIIEEVQTTENLNSVVEESVIEETVIDESHMEGNENSNDSFDFMSEAMPNYYLHPTYNNERDLMNDKASTFSDSEEIGVRKRVVRKLSSSENMTQSPRDKAELNSDSDTDVDKKINKKKGNTSSKKLVIDSDSDTDIEITTKPKKVVKTVNSDSETDMEDNVMEQHSSTPSQEVIRPKSLTKKRVLDSDSETDIEDDKEKEIVPEVNTNTSENLNDTDCIPATQDAFADVDMFNHKDSKMSKLNINSENVSSEESFRLGLTELMVENTENNQEVEEVNNKETRNSSDNVKIDDNTKIKALDGKTTEDLYMMPTQKVDVLEEHKQILDTNTEEEQKDDIYMAPTQKLTHSVENKLNVPTCSKDVDTEKISEDEFYMMPTQSLNQNEEQSQFKVPMKKFNFRKREIKLDESLSKVLSSNQDDLYLAPTQQINEKTTEDLYRAPTQDLSINGANNDEDPYMAPTQVLHFEENKVPDGAPKASGKIDEDLYLAATQPVVVTSNTGVENKVSESAPKTDEEMYLAATQPVVATLESAVKDKFLQETVDLSLTKDNEANKNEDVDPYMLPTQPLVQNVPQVARNNSEINSGTKRDCKSNQNILQSKRQKQMVSDKVETLSQIEAFVKQPWTSDKPADTSKKIPTVPVVDESETLSQIERFVKEPFAIPKKLKVETLPKHTDSSLKVKDEIVSEEKQLTAPQTLTTNTNEVIDTQNKNALENHMEQKSDNVEVLKSRSLRVRSAKSTPHLKSSDEVCEAAHKNEPKTSSSSKEIRSLSNKQNSAKDVGIETVEEKNVPQAPKPRSSRRITKSTRQSIFEATETSNKVNVEPSTSNLNTDLWTSKKDLTEEAQTSEIRESTKKPEENINKIGDDIDDNKQIDTRITTAKSTYETTNVEPVTHKNNFEHSFALLEAKNTKTRKTQGCNNGDEVKISLRENRRSMTILAVPEEKVSTRRTRKATTTVNNNTLPSTSAIRTSLRSKRKPEPVDVEESVLKEIVKPKVQKLNKAVDTVAELATPSTSKVKVTSKRNTINSKIPLDSHDESSNSSESILSTPSRRGRRKTDICSTPSTPEKLRRKQKPKVVFTMMDSPLLESLIRQLGGNVVDSVEASTVLVTEHVKRSQKLLTTIGQGKPICSPEWIRASKKANEFLDPWDFILVDKEAESKWEFSLKESITRANNDKLLANYTFQVMVNTAVDVLKGAIEACGGKCVPRYPGKKLEGFFVVVSSPENKIKYLKVKKQHPDVTVVEPEAIFDGVLRQELRLGRHLLT